MSGRRDVVILGSTGSIGTQALDVIARNPERFRVVGLAAGGGNVRLLAEQAAAFHVPRVAIADETQVSSLTGALAAGMPHGARPEVLSGASAAAELAGTGCDVVLNGMTGAVGLEPTLSALAAGHRLALANKESLIIGGPLVREAAAPDQIVPVDSEHSALAQCLAGGGRDEVRRLVLTASGGPFRGRTRAELSDVTVAEALAHPTWSMGPVITINSATLVNKGLEVIEAHLLFDIPMDRIAVVVHPQSIVHSMVEFVDGSTLAQASPPDMRLPIAMGLAWPDRLPDVAAPCDWTQSQAWTFDPLDDAAFPAVQLARRAGVAGGTAPAAFNAANEVAVDAFRAGDLSFLGIVDTIAQVLSGHAPDGGGDLTLAAVLASDAAARDAARSIIEAGGVSPSPDAAHTGDSTTGD